MFDEEKIKQGVKLILEGIGEDCNREGLKETPMRIARMYQEIFGGMYQNPEDILNKSFSVDENNLVLEKDITFYSTCEHHLLPFYGKAHIAYIPNGKVVGISKLARTVELYAKRPQIQEQMTIQIAKAIQDNLNCQGVMVVVEAEHTCMTMRGVKKPGTKTTTMSVKGVFQEDYKLQNQVLQLIKKD